jgi:phosphoadenosine phosphosulfate reductase
MSGADRAQARVVALRARYGGRDGAALLAPLIRNEFPGRIALVSSFGIESAVLLHMVAAIDPATPVLFLDTGKLFAETLRYRDTLVARLGLTDVRSVGPDPQVVRTADPLGTLWATNPDRCCALRKVEPLARALAGFAAWINGRKRYHSNARAHIPTIEAAEGRVKVNPLARWTADDVARYFARFDLPRHPLEAEGFRSVGCLPCSDRAAPDESPRSGRWRGRAKTECGIHLPPPAAS